MKKILTTAVAIILIVTANYAQNVPNYVPTNGLAAWYSFSGNANDESGNGNNGTVNSATLTTDRFGNANKAYSFDGVDDLINVNNINVINTNWTVSFWFNSSNNTSFEIQNILGIGSQTNVFGGATFSINGGISPVQCTVFNSFTNNMYLADASLECGQLLFSQTYSNNNWYYINIINSNGIYTIFVNSVSTSIGSLNNIIIDKLIFGSRDMVNFQYFKGKIDDIGIWNRALTQQEITALYNGCTTPPTATITPQSSTTFCQGNNVVLQAGGGNSYNWSNGVTTQSITVTQGNTYTVTVTDGNNCTASASQVVTVNPNPSVSFTLPTITNIGAAPFAMNGNPSGGTYTGAGVSGNSFNASNAGLGLKQVNYTFTNGNGCFGSASSTTLVYDTSGVVCTSYDTITTTINDTVTTFLSVTDTLLIDVSTGLTPPNNVNTVKVFPNPANNALFINNGNLTSMAGYSIKITNSLGQIFFNEPVNQQQFFIDISTWATGTYLLYVIDPQQAVVETKQVVLQ